MDTTPCIIVIIGIILVGLVIIALIYRNSACPNRINESFSNLDNEKIIKSPHDGNISSPNQKHKICICMYYTSNVASYSRLAESINKTYAQKHGYDFVVSYYRLSRRAPQWDKVIYVRNLLLTKKYDYIFWIDSDAYFNLQYLRLENIIPIKPDIDLYICDDLPNSNGDCLINTGTFLIKSTPWSLHFLDTWWNHPSSKLFSRAPYHEQTVLDEMIKNNPDELMDHIKIFPAEQFNSIICRNPDTLDNNFIAHIMAQPAYVRKDKMMEYIYKNKINVKGF